MLDGPNAYSSSQSRNKCGNMYYYISLFFHFKLIEKLYNNNSLQIYNKSQKMTGCPVKYVKYFWDMVGEVKISQKHKVIVFF